MLPEWSQNAPKIFPNEVFSGGPKVVWGSLLEGGKFLDRRSIFNRFSIDFGAQNGPKIFPESIQNERKIDMKCDAVFVSTWDAILKDF